MADHNSPILQIINQIIANQLPSATERLALRLVVQVNLACGQVNLTWGNFVKLCKVKTRAASRSHLITLKKAALIHYSTDDHFVYITFPQTISKMQDESEAPDVREPQTSTSSHEGTASKSKRPFQAPIHQPGPEFLAASQPTPGLPLGTLAQPTLLPERPPGLPLGTAPRQPGELLLMTPRADDQPTPEAKLDRGHPEQPESSQFGSPMISPPIMGDRVVEYSDTTRIDPSLYIGSLGSLGLGRENESLQTVEKNETLYDLALNLLDECGVVKTPEKLARIVPFDELRAIALRWRVDHRANGPGSLIYRIIHRHESGWDWQLEPLTAAEYAHPFVQRWRTDSEIERDEHAFSQMPSASRTQKATLQNRSDLVIGRESVPEAASEAEPLRLTEPPADEPTSAEPKAQLYRQNLFNWHAAPMPPFDRHNHDSVWLTVKHNFTLQDQRLSVWFEHTRVLGVEDGTWIIGTPNYAKDFLQNRLTNKITRALSETVQHSVNVRFEITPPITEVINYS